MRPAVDKFTVPRATEPAVHLDPGLFLPGESTLWTSQNCTLLSVPHPIHSQLALCAQGIKATETLSTKPVTRSDEKCVQIWTTATGLDRAAFVSETHASFMALQTQMAENTVDMAGLVRISAQYRAALLRQVEKDQVFAQMHAVWHLLEVVYLTTTQHGLDSAVSMQVLQWLNLNFPVQLLEESGRSAAELARSKQLWGDMERMAVRGHVTLLSDLLQRIAPELKASKLAQHLATVAREMPVMGADEMRGEFLVRWRTWNCNMASVGKEIARALSDAPGDAELLGMQRAVAVMAGDGVLAGESWQDVLGACLLYQEPAAQADRLPELTQLAVAEFEASDFTVLDHALIALLQQDLPAFLARSDQIDGWLAAHSADLLGHLRILDSFRNVFAEDPRAFYLRALADSYLVYEELWRVVMDYLGAANATEQMQEVAMRVPMTSDRVTQQVLDVCEKHKLQEAMERILRQRAHQQWRRGRRGAAIADFAQANDDIQVAAVCNELWQEYLESGQLTYGSAIDGVLGVVHPRVQFLALYRDFHEAYVKRELKVAGKALLEILVGELAPRDAVKDLLVDAVPLLEGSEMVFGEQETLEIMRCAEQVRQSGQEEHNSELAVVRAACARNLARAML
ncbi:Nucleoporin nup85 [Linderina pennispora]|nr:Nucleoporin nup85 [Linderina pennispora]